MLPVNIAEWSGRGEYSTFASPAPSAFPFPDHGLYFKKDKGPPSLWFGYWGFARLSSVQAWAFAHPVPPFLRSFMPPILISPGEPFLPDPESTKYLS